MLRTRGRMVDGKMRACWVRFLLLALLPDDRLVMSVFDFPHPLDVGTVWDVCSPGGNEKMIRDLNSVPSGSQLSVSFVSKVGLKAPGGF